MGQLHPQPSSAPASTTVDMLGNVVHEYLIVAIGYTQQKNIFTLIPVGKGVIIDIGHVAWIKNITVTQHSTVLWVYWSFCFLVFASGSSNLNFSGFHNIPQTRNGSLLERNNWNSSQPFVSNLICETHTGDNARIDTFLWLVKNTLVNHGRIMECWLVLATNARCPLSTVIQCCKSHLQTATSNFTWMMMQVAFLSQARLMFLYQFTKSFCSHTW